jgi:hypothetical protein
VAQEELVVAGDELGDQAARRALLQTIGELKPKAGLYLLHKKQYEVQRAYLRDLEANLAVGEAIIWRDFVNLHAAKTGKKVANLVLVVRFREKAGEQLKTLKLSNISMDAKDGVSCDAFFVAGLFARSLSIVFSTRLCAPLYLF